jgi:hypothetical protein
MTTWLSPLHCLPKLNNSSKATLFKWWLINVIWWTTESQFHVTLFQTREWKLVVLFSKPFSDKENSGTKLKSTRGCSQICKTFTHFVECYPPCKVKLRSRWCKDGYCSNSIFNWSIYQSFLSAGWNKIHRYDTLELKRWVGCLSSPRKLSLTFVTKLWNGWLVNGEGWSLVNGEGVLENQCVGHECTRI